MKTRVVAYSRVSSEHEDQLNSLANQKQHWEEYIKSNPTWEYAGMYWDEGITGTSLKKRDGFNRMIADAKSGKFDLIITKQVERWARNIVDSIQVARELKKIGVAVYFVADNIHTIRDNDAELRLSIMSTLAQEGSRRISENVKFGQTRAMKNGIVFGNDRVLGYNIKDKKITINKEEAIIVKKIFDWFVNENESLHGIVKRLADEGITRGKTGGKIDHSTIKRILENEKYCGDLKQRKYVTEDFLEQKQRPNKGEVDFIIIRNNHKPIIPREQWNNAQEILAERRAKYQKGIGYHRHCWGGKIICGVCKDKFRRKVLKNADGSDRPVWICTTALNHGKKGCENSSYIREDTLIEIFKAILKLLNTEKTQEEILNNFKKVISKMLSKNNNQDEEKRKIEQKIVKVKSKREKLLELYMNSNISIEDLNHQNHLLNVEEEKLYTTLNDIQKRIDHLQKTQIQTLKFLNLLKAEISDPKIVDDIVNNHVKEIIKYKNKMIFIFNVGEKIQVSFSKLPKGGGTLGNIPIMDTKIMYLIDRGCVKYYESLKVQAKLVV